MLERVGRGAENLPDLPTSAFTPRKHLRGPPVGWRRCESCLTATYCSVGWNPTNRIRHWWSRLSMRCSLAGGNPCYTSQNLGEFWNVLTRPIDRNGFGLTPAEANDRARIDRKPNETAPRHARCSRRMAKAPRHSQHLRRPGPRCPPRCCHACAWGQAYPDLQYARFCPLHRH